MNSQNEYVHSLLKDGDIKGMRKTIHGVLVYIQIYILPLSKTTETNAFIGFFEDYQIMEV